MDAETIGLKEDSTATLTLVPALKVTAADGADLAEKATYTYAPTGITKGGEFELSSETPAYIAEGAVVTVKAKEHTSAGNYGYINVAIAGAAPVATGKSAPVTSSVTSVATGEQTLKRASKAKGEAEVYEVEFGLTVSVDSVTVEGMTIAADTEYDPENTDTVFGTVTVTPEEAAEEEAIVCALDGRGLVAGDEGKYTLGKAGSPLTGTITITLKDGYFADAAKLKDNVGCTDNEDISVTVASATKNGTVIKLTVTFTTTAAAD